MTEALQNALAEQRKNPPATPRTNVAAHQVSHSIAAPRWWQSKQVTLPNTDVILMRKGTIEQHPIERESITLDPEAPGKAGEVYVCDPQLRFWNPESIPAGFVTLHVQGDPEPVTTRRPRGYGSEILWLLVGSWWQHLFGATDLPPEDTKMDWFKIALYAGIGVAVLVLGYIAYTQGWFGTAPKTTKLG
ncbi:MAG TPA: hypothetical protein VM286_06250 [Candidatus Thermoplasmatota archaeon]|nr:hypothetical protein [Candidatus Thermoplasmatota archaeon]